METAREIGMRPMQAAWYLKEGTNQPAKRNAEFTQAESPMDVILEIQNNRLS